MGELWSVERNNLHTFRIKHRKGILVLGTARSQTKDVGGRCKSWRWMCGRFWNPTWLLLSGSGRWKGWRKRGGKGWCVVRGPSAWDQCVKSIWDLPVGPRPRLGRRHGLGIRKWLDKLLEKSQNTLFGGWKCGKKKQGKNVTFSFPLFARNGNICICLRWSCKDLAFVCVIMVLGWYVYKPARDYSLGKTTLFFFAHMFAHTYVCVF